MSGLLSIISMYYPSCSLRLGKGRFLICATCWASNSQIYLTFAPLLIRLSRVIVLFISIAPSFWRSGHPSRLPFPFLCSAPSLAYRTASGRQCEDLLPSSAVQCTWQWVEIQLCHLLVVWSSMNYLAILRLSPLLKEKLNSRTVVRGWCM